jgi:two-component system response regulator PilR (NtrC family)
MDTNYTALILDDEADIRELLEITLGRMSINTASAADIKAAKKLLKEQSFNLCLTDMNLPDGNGIDFVAYIQNHYPHIPVAMITAYGNAETAVEALKAGAFDFVSKPIELERLRNLVNSALKLESGNDNLFDNSNEIQLIGNTAAAQQLKIQINKLARSQAPVFISGESGSGKELVARLIHSSSPRRNAPFVPVNCGAIPSELMESEFFGHKKGSFTGAGEDKKGLFQAAEGGTLFLDEVADLPLAMQVKLLRVIQEKAVRSIGAHEELATDVRILSASHKDLATEVEEERFRSDLYYRINVIELQVPSLRERVDDIPQLAQKLLSKIAEESNATPPAIDEEALSLLKNYHFPGNVRELENILERAFTLCENNIIRTEDLQLAENPVSVSATASSTRNSKSSANSLYPPINTEDAYGSLESFMENIEKEVITKALEQSRWNKTAAAKLLGISFRALRYRLKKLDLE